VISGIQKQENTRMSRLTRGGKYSITYIIFSQMFIRNMRKCQCISKIFEDTLISKLLFAVFIRFRHFMKIKFRSSLIKILETFSPNIDQFVAICCNLSGGVALIV